MSSTNREGFQSHGLKRAFPLVKTAKNRNITIDEMIQFKLFGFPVRIQWMFWILCAILGMGYLQQGGRYGFVMLLILTATVLVSILWHELGHALYRKKFGAPYSEITLWGMGGLCSGPGQFTRSESIMISAAGPIFNFILGGLVYLLKFTPLIEDPYVKGFFYIALFVNIVWGILNLLPILPMDGGRIFEAIMSDKNPRIVPWVGLILAVLIAVFGGLREWYFAMIMFGLMALENWKMIQMRQYRGF